MLDQFTDDIEIEIFVTISSYGIPFNFNVQHDDATDPTSGVDVEVDEEDNVGDLGVTEIEDAVGDKAVAEKEYSVEDEGGAHTKADHDGGDDIRLILLDMRGEMRVKLTRGLIMLEMMRRIRE
uniref:Uncharacterized protein n=1 Tax=Ananas comosus var. bracteatus TaxID=296719 RepID=A0A6V7NT11_ANACO|nr:unnamed protein product [Ananas comosus var. bracteatus]